MKILSLLSFKNRKFIACATLAICAVIGTEISHALSTAYYTTNSKLSSGKWVKIKTTGEGIHQITYDQLREWGFDQPEKVNVYGYGGTLLSGEVFSVNDPDDVQLTYTDHAADRLFFYSTSDLTVNVTTDEAVKTSRNLYSKDVFYLLGDRDLNDDERLDPAAFKTTNHVNYDAHLSVVYTEDELYNPLQMGGYFFGKNFTGSTIDVPFEFKNMGNGSTTWKTMTVRLGFGAYNKSTTKLNVTAPAGLPSSTSSQQAASLAYDIYEKYTLGYTTLTFKNIVNNLVKDGTYSFTCRPTNSPSLALMDYSWAIYPRLSKMSDDAQLSMYFPHVTGEQNFSVEGSETVHVVNVTDPSHVFAHELKYDAEKVTGSFDRAYASGQSGCHLIAYDTAAQQKPVEFVEELANQNLHGIEVPDMVIITIKELLPAAEELAELHRQNDGMDVAVIEHTQLFNEFSSATPEIMGYRRFLKMLRDRDSEKFKYVIMYGPSHYDNRAINADKKDRLLIYETANKDYSRYETKAFCTDSYLGFLNDNFSPAAITAAQLDVPVGRIPVSNTVQGYTVNRKIKRHMESLPSAALYNTMLLMSDDGDSNQHINDAEDLGKLLLTKRPTVTVVKTHNSIYPWESNDAKLLRSIATNALTRGVGLFTYVGHGNEDAFAAQKVWSRSATTYTSYELPPLGLFATCTAFGFDLGKDGIGQEMLLKENGGLIGLITASRVVYGTLNQDLASKVIEEYANAKEGATLGKIWMSARNKAISSTTKEDSRINTLCFNLGGDPALRVIPPTYKVELTKAPESGIIEPLKTIELEGQITTLYGELADDFNGTVTLQLYDSPYTVDILVRDKNDVAGKIELDHDILMTKTVEVRDGKFAATFVVPVPVHENADKVNRLTIHADAYDGRRGDGIFSGYKVVASVEGSDEEMPGEAPAIEYLAVNDPATTDGAYVTDQVRILAGGTVSDAGLNFSSAIGSGSSLVIDGTSHVSGAKEALKIDNNQWTLALPLFNLSEGHHTATLTIADNLGRRAAQTISFTLGSQSPVELTADVTTVRDEVTFDLLHSLGDITQSRFVIEDRLGNVVFSQVDPVFPLTVNMAVPTPQFSANDGHYTAYVQVRGTQGKGSSARLPLVLIKK